MSLFSLQLLKENDSEYGKLSDALTEKFNCEWDDKVHDSYLNYVNDIRDSSQRVHGIRCNAESVVDEVKNLNIEFLKQKAQELCREADAL